MKIRRIDHFVITAADLMLRHGARGAMQSFYLPDPDGNLVELCRYP